MQLEELITEFSLTPEATSTLYTLITMLYSQSKNALQTSLSNLILYWTYYRHVWTLSWNSIGRNASCLNTTPFVCLVQLTLLWRTISLTSLYLNIMIINLTIQIVNFTTRTIFFTIRTINFDKGQLTRL